MDGQDFLIRSNDMSYVARPIFKGYIRDVVFEYFTTTRETMHLENYADVLLCDNCSSHTNKEVMAMLARDNIRLTTFPPHISHLFQPLDLVTFAAFKREKREIHVSRPDRSQTWQITILRKALEHATDSFNNRAAFKRAGLRINPWVFPPVALGEFRQLIEMIDASTLPDGAGVDGSAEPVVATQRPRATPVFGFRNGEYFPHQ
jgi:transposase